MKTIRCIHITWESVDNPLEHGYSVRNFEQFEDAEKKFLDALERARTNTLCGETTLTEIFTIDGEPIEFRCIINAGEGFHRKYTYKLLYGNLE